MRPKGMFSFTREENTQIGREKQSRTGQKGYKECTKCQTQISNFDSRETFPLCLVKNTLMSKIHFGNS